MSSHSRFVSQLSEAGRIHVDAGVLALHLLGDSSYLDLTRLLFSSLRTGACTAQTSVISIFQIGVEPYRRGEDDLALKACTYVSALPGLEIVPVSGVIATQAAQVRAQLGGRTERAIQIATALVSCEYRTLATGQSHQVQIRVHIDGVFYLKRVPSDEEIIITE